MQLTNREISENDSFASGAFVLNGSKLPYSPFDGQDLLFLTQHQVLTLKSEIIKIINEAKSVLKVCSFIITDKEIFDVLLDKTRKGNVAVFILTQLDSSKLTNSIFLTEEESREQTQQIHLSYIKTLYDAGAHVRASTSAHAKFIIADRLVGFVMSANLTTPSLTFNTEFGIYVDSSCTQSLDRLFDVIFQKGTSFRQYLNAGKKGKQLVVQSEAIIKADWLPHTESCTLRYTYEQLQHSLLSEIRRIIENAKEFLYLSSYSIVSLPNIVGLKEELAKAVARGVEVFVFCRGMNFRTDHLKGCNELSSIGCKIFGDVYNHSKGIVNESEGLLFTANLDGIHGLNSGFEVGTKLSNNAHKLVIEFHRHLVATSPFAFKADPTRKELFEMYDDLEKTKSINAPQFAENLLLVVKKGPHIKREELEKDPIYYGRSKDANKEQFIIVGNSFYKASYEDGVFSIHESAKTTFNIEKFILRFKNLKIEYRP
jgi:hypothetical protein